MHMYQCIRLDCLSYVSNVHFMMYLILFQDFMVITIQSRMRFQQSAI
jgi:hypothetical protein